MSLKGDAWDPAQYAKFEAERTKPFLDLMEGAAARMTDAAGPRVLDLGCGSGELTLRLHERLGASETVGVDSSTAMLSKTRALAAPSSGRVRFVESDLRDYREPARYDLVFSNAALQWCDDHPSLLASLRDLVAPGGLFAVQVPANGDYPTHRIADSMARDAEWRGKLDGSHVGRRVLAPEEYARTLWKLGFEEPDVRLQVYAHVFPDRTRVLEWVKGTLLTSAKSRLDPESHARYLAEYERRLYAELPDEKPFFYPFKRVLFWARRTR
jgi:trans-aconitate 2-methyltransferase